MHANMLTPSKTKKKKKEEKKSPSKFLIKCHHHVLHCFLSSNLLKEKINNDKRTNVLNYQYH